MRDWLDKLKETLKFGVLSFDLVAISRGPIARDGHRRPTRRPATGGSVQRLEMAQDPDGLIKQRADHKNDVEASIGRGHCDSTEREINRRAYQILDSKTIEVSGSLEDRIGKIEHEGQRQKAEEPFPPREEVVLIPAIFLDVVRKQQRAKQVEHDRVAEQRQVDFEGPLLDEGQPELPPPEMHQRDQHEHHPSEVDP